MASYGSWVSMREVVDRLSPLLPKDRYLVPERFETNFGLGFGGGQTVLLAITVHGPQPKDEVYLRVERSSADECLDVMEEMIR